MNARIRNRIATALTAASVTLAAGGLAHAAEWATVAADADETVFVDLESLAVAGSSIEAQVLHNFTRIRTLGDDWYEHRSRVMRYRVSCESGRLGFVSFEMMSGELGSGSTVFAGTTSGELFDAADDTMDGRLVYRLCTPAIVARAERQTARLELTAK
jgi:hypothetical protein